MDKTLNNNLELIQKEKIEQLKARIYHAINQSKNHKIHSKRKIRELYKNIK